MALIHNALRGPFGRQLVGVKTMLGQTDPESGVERYSETLQPTMDPWGRPERQLLLGEEIAVAGIELAAGGAGNFGKAGLSYPVLLNRIFTVTHHLLSAAAATTFRLYFDGAGMATNTQLFTTDRRNRNARTAILLQSDTNAVNDGTATVFSVPVIANELVILELPIIMASGGPRNLASRFYWRPQVDNTAVRYSFIGYERHALPGELE